MILEYRGLAKLKSTYTDKLPEHGQPAHRARAHQLRAGGRGDRAAVVATTRTCRTSRSARAEGRRIREAFIAPAGLRDRWRPTTRRSSCASWRTSPATRACCAPSREDRDIHRATAAEVFGVPLDAGHARAAPLRQGDQLRPDLRHERLRPGAQPRHRPRRGAATTSSATSRAIPGVKRYMDETRAQRARATATSRPCSAGGCTCPTSTRATASCAQCAERSRDQRADAGHRGRHHQARDDRGRCLAAIAQARRRG